MTTIVTRAGKGLPLTNTEMDSNLTNLNTDKAEVASLTAHIDDTVAAHAASAIANTPAGNIVATTVQAAIDELDTEKVTSGGALGTPASGTLTSCTGLPISTGVSGLAANVATFLATPSSANLAAALTDETGTGSVVFSASPTLTGTTQVAALTASGLATLNGGAAVTGALSATTTFSLANISTNRSTNLGNTGTFVNFLRLDNTGGALELGLDNSTGGVFAMGAYSSVLSAPTDFRLVRAGTLVLSGTATGVSILSSTTASAANVYQSASGGELLRSTSSIRYKRDIEDIQPSYAHAALNLRPVWYRSNATADNQSWSYYGLIAEEVAQVEPRLVHWAHEGTKQELVSPAVDARPAEFDAEGIEISPAIEAKDAMYREVIDTASPLIPDGVQYERLSVLLLKLAQEQQATINSLEARLTAAGL